MNHMMITGLAEITKYILLSIREATEQKLGRPVEVKIISYPQHICMTPFATFMTNTAIEVYPEFEDNLHYRVQLNCVRLAYGLDQPEPLGYPPGTNLQNCSNTNLLHIVYEQDFLEVSIVEIDQFFDAREKFFRIDNFGQEATESSVFFHSRRGCRTPIVTIPQPPDIALFKTQLKRLLDEEYAERFGGPNRTNQVDDYRGVIFSGSASALEFKSVREGMLQVMPEFEGIIKDGIEPLWVAAHGAAIWAMRPQFNPQDIVSGIF